MYWRTMGLLRFRDAVLRVRANKNCSELWSENLNGYYTAGRLAIVRYVYNSLSKSPSAGFRTLISFRAHTGRGWESTEFLYSSERLPKEPHSPLPVNLSSSSKGWEFRKFRVSEFHPERHLLVDPNAQKVLLAARGGGI